ncbi:PH domain-containing protein [uncultured Arthrobacter sp.]|uniref:PH domain-containing protein n=1 Tax=uncultured Arthrobacter sp. TaxID=114050 RepID=UPI00260EE0C1|nr:PH domain-containing protein [uncultured Arthrobacter sp.]
MTESAPDPALLSASPGEWKRVHIISPLVRGWIAIAALIFFGGRDWFEGLLTGNPGGFRGEAVSNLPIAIAIIVGVVLLIAGGFFLSWYYTRYQVTEEHVRVNSGVIFRQHRQARLDRVQAIDVVQPFLARVFELAELKFDVADAGESAVRLSFLKLGEAQKLRATILARAAGVAVDPEHPQDIPEAPEREVLALAPARVIGAAALSGNTVAVVLGSIGVVVFAFVLDTGALLAAFVPILIGVVSGYWNVLNTGFNFRAAISPDGIRIRYGLLDTRTQTVPPGRVQAVGVIQSPLWRLKGWYKVTVNVAGYGASASGEAQARATLLPVGTLDEVLKVIALVLPDPGTDKPLEVFSAGLAGRDSDAGFITTPRRARLIAPMAWRRNGVAVTGTALLARSGAWWRQLAVVPHERTQSLALHEGPLAKRFGVADLIFHTTPGPVSPRVRQIPEQDAWRLFSEQAERAADARRRSGPEQWMRPVPVEGAAEEPGALPENAVMPAPPSYLEGPAHERS